ERLRHKNRAVSIFDYERLVLEQFPQVYKVKCINHTNQCSEYAPGHVRLIVVPDLRNRNAVDPLQPKLPKNTLSEIEKYLKAHTSDFAEIHVTNPQYEMIKVAVKIVFHADRDKGFYKQQLQNDIKRFLSPWLYDDAADLSFGGRIHRTWILKHIEKLEYVDYLTDFTMDHITRDETIKNIEEARVKSSSSVLVSCNEHAITLQDPSSCRLKRPELA
ncbi:MAG: phage baseplate protein, partial [Candidatus Electrothrix sp. ATG1]|nr:phage baseplate protein [Candidatus Electrothrix sp. ATG1]